MINEFERRTDIINILSKLDISPSMFKNAEEKYMAISHFIQDKMNCQVNIYPQGSFAYGTVIRPYDKENDTLSYDLDFVCEIECAKDAITPANLLESVKKEIDSSGLYGGKIVGNDECITIEYADINDISFSIDIVVATPESREVIDELYKSGDETELYNLAISIAMKKDNKYEWITNNPKGYKIWFDGVNRPFLDFSRERFRKSLFEQSHFYSSVEEIPSGMERSEMQRAIQLLKYHRDVFFSNISSSAKPISAIINTIVAKISCSLNPTLSCFEIIDAVLNEAYLYSKLLNDPQNYFNSFYSDKKIITHYENIWKMENPANPKDNMLDSWNEDEENARYFFKWVSFAKKDLIDSATIPDNQFRAVMENTFGRSNVQKHIGNKYLEHESLPVNKVPKPWEKNDF